MLSNDLFSFFKSIFSTARFTKFNNLIPYPGTKLYNDIKETRQIHISDEWSNFNSTLVSTRSIFNKVPLPYVPEGTHPWDLKREIISANLGFYFRPKPIFDFLLRRGKGAFLILPKGWMKNPREVYEVAKLGVILLINYLVSLLPHRVGYLLYCVVTGDTLEDRSGVTDKKNPDAIDGTMRTIKFDTKKNRINLEAGQRIQNPLNNEDFVTEKKENLSKF